MLAGSHLIAEVWIEFVTLKSQLRITFGFSVTFSQTSFDSNEVTAANGAGAAIRLDGRSPAVFSNSKFFRNKATADKASMFPTSTSLFFVTTKHVSQVYGGGAVMWTKDKPSFLPSLAATMVITPSAFAERLVANIFFCHLKPDNSNLAVYGSKLASFPFSLAVVGNYLVFMCSSLAISRRNFPNSIRAFRWIQGSFFA